MPSEPTANPTFLSVSQTAQWMAFAEVEDREFGTGHLALGPHSIRGAYCENCERPLHRVLSLDVVDPLWELPALPFSCLHLLFCPTCDERPWPFHYGIREDDSVAVFQHGRGGRSLQFPYPDYPEHFPRRAVSFTPVPQPSRRSSTSSISAATI